MAGARGMRRKWKEVEGWEPETKSYKAVWFMVEHLDILE